MTTTVKNGKIVKIIVAAVIALVVIALAASSVAIIPAGHKGVLVTMGAVQSGVLDEGINFKLPFVQNVVNVDTRVKKHESDASSASKDLQQITSTIAVNYRLAPDAVDKLYQNIGTNYESNIISPAINECVKAVTAQYTAEELVTKRSDVSVKMKEMLQEKLKDKYIMVDSFNVVDFGFSEQFDKAIEEKQIAEQAALKAKYDLERIKTEGEQAVAQAQAEAEALRLKSQEVTKDLILLEYIQKWDGKLPTYSGGDNAIIQLPDLTQAEGQ